MDDLSIRAQQNLHTGTAGAMGAAQKHLADMRAIAAKFLKVELPK
jgi:hypothetical protein